MLLVLGHKKITLQKCAYEINLEFQMCALTGRSIRQMTKIFGYHKKYTSELYLITEIGLVITNNKVGTNNVTMYRKLGTGR